MGKHEQIGDIQEYTWQDIKINCMWDWLEEEKYQDDSQFPGLHEAVSTGIIY